MTDAPQNKTTAVGFVFTSNATAKTLSLSKQQPHQQFPCLRVYLAGKGCDGFTYGVQFDHKLESDHEFVIGKHIRVICDPQSYQFVKGSTIDYVDDERGAGYVVENPRHSDYQGKFYKQDQWQESLSQMKEAITHDSSRNKGRVVE